MNNFRAFYFFDVLCGWCYGFSPVIRQLYERFKDQVEFTAVSGGMVTGDRAGPVAEMAPYLRQAYQRVEEVTGVKFGDGFLEGTLNNKDAIFSSWKPAIALAVFRTYHRKKTIPFAGALQRGVYYDGMLPDEWDSYGPYAQEFGIPAAEFIEKMKQPRYRESAEQDFSITADFGINGFPTLMLSSDEKLYVLSKGYAPLEPLADKIEELLEGKVKI